MFSVFYKLVDNIASLPVILLQMRFMSDILKYELSKLFDFAQQNHFRGCMLLAGSEQWCEQSAHFCLDFLFEKRELERRGFDKGRLDKKTLDNRDITDSAGQYTQPDWQAIWLGDGARLDVAGTKKIFLQQLQPADARQVLGTDADCIVMNTRSGFSPDSLAMLTGTLKGGSILLLLTPDFDQWSDYNDPDYQRFLSLRPTNDSMSGHYIHRAVQMFEQECALLSHHAKTITQPSFLSILAERDNQARPLVSDNTKFNERIPKLIKPVDGGVLMPVPEQLNLIRGVLELSRQAQGFILLTADRGRGKTVALGLSIRELLLCSDATILVTAPLRRNVDNLFAVLNDLDAEYLQRVKYVAVDQLITQVTGNKPQKEQAANAKSATTLLIIDEAAAIPLPILYRLADNYPRAVFSSTVQGYEGSGRGFVLRFITAIKKRYDDVREFNLSQAMRWASGDPLEPFLRRLLLLDCDAPLAADKVSVDLSRISIRSVSSSELLANESLLRAVFGLLMEAHYQTRPSDLRQLLDLPYIFLWIAELMPVKDNKPVVVAVLLSCEEGGFEGEEFATLLSTITQGKRRPQGNLLAQSLAQQSANAEWCRVKSLRVMRVAVSSACRRHGIATRLLQVMEQFAIESDFSYWGSSFGFDPALMQFWRQHNALPVQLGLHLDRASGTRNIMVVKALSARMHPLVKQMTDSFDSDLAHYIVGYMPELAVSGLERQVDPLGRALTDSDTAVDLRRWDAIRLERFLHGEISYDKVYPTLCRLCSSAGTMTNRQLAQLPLTLASLELAPNWLALARQFALSGRREVINAIKTELIQLTID